MSLIANTILGAPNGGTTSGINTTGAKFIAILHWIGESTIGTVSDSKGNTWTGLTIRSSGSMSVRIFYCINPTVGTGHTFTWSASGQFGGIAVQAFDDSVSAFDSESTGGSSNGSSQILTPNAGSFTPGVNNCLIVGINTPFNVSLSTISGGSWTISNQVNIVGGNNFSGGAAYQNQTTATGVTLLWNMPGGGVGVGALAAFSTAAPATNIPIPLATMALVTFAPVLTADTPVPVGDLAITTYAPTLGQIQVIPIPVGSLAFATYPPALSISIPIPKTALGFTTYAPQVSPVQINVPVAVMDFATFAPGVIQATEIEIPTGHLQITTYAPIVVQANLGPCAERFGPKLYFWEPSFLYRPEDIEMRATDWEDAGLVGAKFLQGFLLQADTQGVNKTIIVQGDGVDLQTYVINHNGETILPYVFDPTQIASLLRIISPDEVDWRYFGVRWIWEPLPELVTYYETQGTTHDLSGYQFLKDGYISLISTADVTLTINVDGTNFVYTIPSTGGAYLKNYILFGINGATGQTLKGKLFSYILESNEPFRLFQKDCEIRTHEWSSGGYVVRQPFGETSRVYGARI